MTYEEAIKVKNSYGEFYYSEGRKHTTRIVPELEDEKIKFLSLLRSGEVSDTEVKKYSSNNKFAVQSFDVEYYPNLL